MRSRGAGGAFLAGREAGSVSGGRSANVAFGRGIRWCSSIFLGSLRVGAMLRLVCRLGVASG